MRSFLPGMILDVRVKEGDLVNKGDVSFGFRSYEDGV